MDAYKMLEEKTRWELPKNVMCYFEQFQEATPYKTAVVWPLSSHLKNHFSKTNKICRTYEERQFVQDSPIWRILDKVMFFYGFLFLDVPGLIDQQEFTYISSVRTHDVIWKTCWERWMIGTDGESVCQGNLCRQRDLMMMMMIEWLSFIVDPTNFP